MQRQMLHIVQAAAVWADGVRVGLWVDAGSNHEAIWADSQFMLPECPSPALHVCYPPRRTLRGELGGQKKRPKCCRDGSPLGGIGDSRQSVRADRAEAGASVLGGSVAADRQGAVD